MANIVLKKVASKKAAPKSEKEPLKPFKGCIAGYVKGPKVNKDQSITFRVVCSRAKKISFKLKLGSKHLNEFYAASQMDNGRLLVSYSRIEAKNPVIEVAFANPSCLLIRQYMSGQA